MSFWLPACSHFRHLWSWNYNATLWNEQAPAAPQDGDDGEAAADGAAAAPSKTAATVPGTPAPAVKAAAAAAAAKPAAAGGEKREPKGSSFSFGAAKPASAAMAGSSSNGAAPAGSSGSSAKAEADDGGLGAAGSEELAFAREWVCHALEEIQEQGTAFPAMVHFLPGREHSRLCFSVHCRCSAVRQRRIPTGSQQRPCSQRQRSGIKPAR